MESERASVGGAWLLVLALLLPLDVSARVALPMDETASDLFLVLTNDVSGRTEIVDLGPVGPSIGAPRRWKIDPRYAATLGSGPISYLLVGADRSGQGLNAFAGARFYTSANPATLARLDGRYWTAARITSAIYSVDRFLSLVATRFVAVGGLQTYVSSGSAFQNWGPANAHVSAPGHALGVNGFDASVPVGREAPLYSLTAGPEDVGPATDAVIRRLGRFLLRGRDLEFHPEFAATEAAPGPDPVPAR